MKTRCVWVGGEGAAGRLDGGGSAPSHIWWWLVSSPPPGTENVSRTCASVSHKDKVELLCVCADCDGPLVVEWFQ